MRPLQLLLPLSLAVLASSAGAQNLPYPPPDTAPLSTVQVSGLAADMRIAPRQARRISGAYEMSNGWYLRVNTAVRHIDAIIDDQKPLRLVQVAHNKFASGDGNVTMEFGRGIQRDEMAMSYVPGDGLAQRVVISSTLAQR